MLTRRNAISKPRGFTPFQESFYDGMIASSLDNKRNDKNKINEVKNNDVKPKIKNVEETKVLLCGIAKLENNYIREWVEHYKDLGFDNICLIDNNDKDGEHFEDVIGDYIESGFVIVENARGKYHYQIESYNVYYEKYRKNYDWIAFFDIDEFLDLDKKYNNNVKNFVCDKIFNDFNCIRVCWQNYDDNDLIKVENGNYNCKERFKRHIRGVMQTKAIIRTTYSKIFNKSSHIISSKLNISSCNTKGIECEQAISIGLKETWINAKLKHYRFKTIEEFVTNKMKRGWPTWYEDVRPINLSLFFEFNKRTQAKVTFAKSLMSSKTLKKVELKKQPIINTNQCCGCASCALLCPVKAITMVEDKEGFKYPSINKEKCINCGKCKNACFINQPKEKKNLIKVFGAYSKDNDIRKKSSSGGLFYELAKNTFKKGGIVFGVKYDENFNIVYDYAETLDDIEKLMKSKYYQADTNQIFEKVKEELTNEKNVLFVGTPCFVNGLKTFLGKKYEKLILVDFLCHGVPSHKIFNQYLINDDINPNNVTNIDFRNKEHGWSPPSIKIETKNKIIHKETKNFKYMIDFCSNEKILRKSCYDCISKQYDNGSDITIGDFWSINLINRKFNDNKGVSVVIIRTQTGETIFNEIKDNINYFETTLNKDYMKYNGGFSAHFDLKNKKEVEFTKPKEKNVGILTLTLHSNCGGILQAYAVSELVKENGMNPILIEKSVKHLPFVDEHIKIKNISNPYNLSEKDFSHLIVGSDQVWRPQFAGGRLPHFFLNFAEKWNVKKMVYAASFGTEKYIFNTMQGNIAKNLLPKFDVVTVREDSAVNICKSQFNVNAKHVLDPTMLLSKEKYLSLINEEYNESGDTVFGYILDDTNDKSSCVNVVSKQLNLPSNKKLPSSINEFLHNFNNAKVIVTDSFHGCVFSIIFNKPFIVYNNEKRGNARIASLLRMFNLTHRMIKTFKEEKINDLINESLNVNSLYDELKNDSYKIFTDFLKS